MGDNISINLVSICPKVSFMGNEYSRYIRTIRQIYIWDLKYSRMPCSIEWMIVFVFGFEFATSEQHCLAGANLVEILDFQNEHQKRAKTKEEEEEEKPAT